MVVSFVVQYRQYSRASLLMPTDQSILVIFAAVVFFFLLVSIRRRREAIRHKIRSVLIVEAAYIGTAVLLAKVGRPAVEAVLAGIVVALIVDRLLPARSRHVPGSVRRRKVAEFEMRTGEKFDSQKHELDHEVPFSRGGSHTLDNLRVVEKRVNRAKGRKSPWWDLLGR